MAVTTGDGAVVARSAEVTRLQIAASVSGVSGGASVLMRKGTELMKSGQVALALAGGYLLGRFHKMRLALAVAGVAAGKRLRQNGGGLPTGLLKSPEMERLAQDIRGELLKAGRAAAVSAVGTRINELSDRMGERAAAIREPHGEAEEGDEEGEGAPDKAKARQSSGGGKSRRVSRGRSGTEASTRSRSSSRASTKPSSSGSRTKRTAREEKSGSGTAGRSTRQSRE